MEKYQKPIKTKGERVWRTYIGGREIRRLYDDASDTDDHYPEEWMYSVTRAVNSGRETITEGVCRLDQEPDVTLKELLDEHALVMLGAAHMERFGCTPGVLIKLIDSQERLTIQVHPDKETALKLFKSPFGKTECWYILGVRCDEAEVPCIYLGFQEGITEDAWRNSFKRQDRKNMLNQLNRIEVKPGETYLVKGGVPHAIGAGCLIMEIQEPTDFTIRVEKVTPAGFQIDDSMCHQGLGFNQMFECFHYEGLSLKQAEENYRIKEKKIDWPFGDKKELVGYDSTNCFRIQELSVSEYCQLEGENVFYCLYILEGKGCVILSEDSEKYEIKKHDQFFIPANMNTIQIKNTEKHMLKMLKLYGPNVKI